MPGSLFTRRTLIAAASAILVGFSIPPAQSETTVRLSGWDAAVYDSLNRPVADPETFYEVLPGAIWESDLGTYTFESGTLAFFRRVGGHPTGCLFEGKGTFTFTPPTAIEQGQLSRFCGAPVLHAAVKRAYFRFYDSSIAAGLYAARGEPSEKKPPKKRKLSKYETRAADDLSIRLAARAWQLPADRELASAFLYAAPDLKGQRRLHFLLDETAEDWADAAQIDASRLEEARAKLGKWQSTAARYEAEMDRLSAKLAKALAALEDSDRLLMEIQSRMYEDGAASDGFIPEIERQHCDNLALKEIKDEEFKSS
ncbi:MAG: hypothetical protein IIA44_06185 [Acidobacteria bacterium]|nr:hypothetical protein [Acidobacteriota bacterium]